MRSLKLEYLSARGANSQALMRRCRTLGTVWRSTGHV